MKKVSNVLLYIFSIGVLLTLFAGAVSVLGYIYAMIIGGDKAELICGFIKNEYYPWVIKITSVAVGCGLLGMYFSKKKALTVNDEKN